jgi:murein DD-endopeptidase MepM/ murein hydrolase activator NlpD
MALLQAAVNYDPAPSKGGGDIETVEKQALLPRSGPLGTEANIADLPASDQISIYVVREGDSLSGIAKMFGVSVNTIYWGNDLKNGDLIRNGQTLVILPVSGIRHIVSVGDTVEKIAEKYKGDVQEILNYNNIASGASLEPGNVIIIPNGELDTAVFSYQKNSIRGSGGPVYEGYFIRPIDGGRRSQGLHGYNAVDLAAPYGTPIFAAASGEVIVSRTGGWNGGYGNYIVIAHPNGTQTLYGHTSENIVFRGMRVVQGQVIGYIGSTGRSTGPHVHFEVRGAANPF